MSNNLFTDWKVGDIVEAFGIRGVITRIDDDEHPLVVSLEGREQLNYFCIDGRYMHWHKAPSLKFISRAPKKVKKKVWVEFYKSSYNITGVSSYVHKTRERALEHECDNTICIKEIEIEMEET